MNVVSQRLQYLRRKQNKKQSEVVADLHISLRGLQRYESGQCTPNLEPLMRLADYYNVSMDYLLGRTDDPTPPVHRVTADVVGKPDTTGD